MTVEDQNYAVVTHRAISEIAAEDWDVCANPAHLPYDPFVSHRFLKALESSGSVGDGTGWQPYHLTLHEGGNSDTPPVCVIPCYGKSHSQGEYVFDHAWADAYHRAGGHYYPKLQIAVPFSPVGGRRILAQKADFLQGGLQGSLQAGLQASVSGLHITFCTEAESLAGEALGMLRRQGQQYHWRNNGYETFEDFLAELSARKRKAIRKERKLAQGFGGEIQVLTGAQIEPFHWDAFWTFYQDTGARKWGTPYLTRAFFDEAQKHLRDDILLILAKREGRYVAGALNMIGADCLYGRYWGCTEHHPALHFELCYYQAIDYAIKNKMPRVEAGAQGDHKLARGYMPVATHSLHHLADKGLHDAVARYLKAERAAVSEDIEILTEYGPFKKTQIEEQQ